LTNTRRYKLIIEKGIVGNLVRGKRPHGGGCAEESHVDRLEAIGDSSSWKKNPDSLERQKLQQERRRSDPRKRNM